MSLLITVAVGLAVQQSLGNNVIYGDVPDNHFAYDVLRDLRSGGLLPELPGQRGGWYLTRGQFGAYITEATINLGRYVDRHRFPKAVKGFEVYSEQLTDLSGEQLQYLVAVVPRIRRVAKTFSMNLPSYVSWKGLDRSLEDEGKRIDGLLAAP